MAAKPNAKGDAMRPEQKRNIELTPEVVVLGLAGAIQRLGAATSIIGGSIAVEVSGEGGGRWRLDLDVPGGACRAEDMAPASTTLIATPEALVAFFLDPRLTPGMREAGLISVSGDTERLKRLATMLRQTRSWLDRS
jgi:hypothetical protein